MKENSLAVFEDYKIRRIYDEESETWYFSLVDIIQVLIQQPDYQAARNYWKDHEIAYQIYKSTKSFPSVQVMYQ